MNSSRLDAPDKTGGKWQSAIWSMGLSSAVVLGALLWWHNSHGIVTQPSLPRREEALVRPALKETTTDPKKRELTIPEAVAYWDQHKESIDHAVRVDLPAALAKRQVNTPDLHGIALAGVQYREAFQTKNRTLAEAVTAVYHDHPELAQKEMPLKDVKRCLDYIRALSDPTPIGSGSTVAELAREAVFAPDGENQPYTGSLRNDLKAAEQLAPGDAGTAAHLESLKSGEERLAYLQEAAPRYEAAYRQALESSPLDAAGREYVDDVGYVNLVYALAQQQLMHGNVGVDAALQEYGATLKRLYRVLGEASADDAESRRALTEIKDLRDAVDKQLIQAEAKPNQALQPTAGASGSLSKFHG